MNLTATINHEEAVCPLCGNREHNFVFTERKHKVLACQVCDLLFIEPYGSNVHDKVSTYNYDDLKIVSAAKHYEASKIYYNRHFPPINSECANAQSLLDMGCGTGRLLELWGRANPNTLRIGVELNIERADYARRVAGCEIYQIPIEKFEYEKIFEVITLINVVSHIPSIDDLFSSIRNLIADNGKLILKVGEVKADVKKGAWGEWGIPDLLHFLGLNTVQFICHKYGFQMIRHDRQPLSLELFSRGRWITPGRVISRDIMKRMVAMTPFALDFLRTIYEKRHKDTAFTSFIVLSPRW